MPEARDQGVQGRDRRPAAAPSSRWSELAEKARRDGLLALEERLEKIDDAFTKKGLQLVVDGTDSDLVRAILQSEIDGMAERHHHGALNYFATLGGFAPTLGILGTVLSLVHVLENLSSPATLGHSIAGAFLATLYGVGSANIIFLPIAQQAQGACRRRRSTTARCCSRRSSRSRPATTRACSREKLETLRRRRARAARTSPPAARGRARRCRRRGREPLKARRHEPRAAAAAAASTDGADERWLLTYADMITLLMALFIVMWAISSVNISKFAAAQELAAGGVHRQDAGGRQGVLEGEPSASPACRPRTRSAPSDISDQHARTASRSDRAGRARSRTRPRSTSRTSAAPAAAGRRAMRSAHGLRARCARRSTSAAWSIRLLTDEVLFDTGQAVLKPGSRRCSTRSRA